MRFPSLSSDHWQLLSAEERNAEAPESCEIPSLLERESLQPGHAAKLMFEIEGIEPDGQAASNIERMWVVVTQRLANGEGYLGVLDNRPRTTRADEDFYLERGCEVPFLPMHVISVAAPPAEYVNEKLATPPIRRWLDVEGR